MTKKCYGCGIELQGEDPKKNGYLPKKVLETSEKELLCQRCFKIKNYGEYFPIEMTKDDYRKEVQKTIEVSKLALPVFDIIDFEGSFDDEILDVLREMDSIVVVNKLDLIPDEKHPSEVAEWVKERLAEEGIAPLDIAIVSSKNGYGVNGILRKIKHFYKDGVTAMVLGVTNVGKSSIINRLLGDKKVTVSKFPGTTLKSIKIDIPKTNISIIDTPGLIPNGRFSDFVCQECNQKIIPSNEISRKTFKVDKGRVILIGGIVKIKILDIEELKPIFSLYASKGVTFHETKEERVEELLEKIDLLNPPCEKCKKEFEKYEKICRKYTVQSDEELVFKGLGWITVKRGPLNIEVETVKGGDIIIRESFIKPKR